MRKLLAIAAVVAASVVGTVAVTASAAPLASPTTLAGCFGHKGVDITGFVAYECVYQPSGLGGALYWSVNLNNFNWDKHPGSGLLWVEASTLVPNAGSNPPNDKQAFWVGIGHQGDFCTVISPGFGQNPTQCEIDGVIQTMTDTQQASYNQFVAAMTSADLPDCAWSQTISSSACNIGAGP